MPGVTSLNLPPHAALLEGVGPAEQKVCHAQARRVEGAAGGLPVEVDYTVAIEWPVHILDLPDPVAPECDLVFPSDDVEIVGELITRGWIECRIRGDRRR